MDATYNLSGGFKPTIKRFADLDGPDFFPTPAWATYALIDNEKFSGEIWESACGDGAMSRVLAQTGCNVLSSDLHNRGYGDVGIDFLTGRCSKGNRDNRFSCGTRKRAVLSLSGSNLAIKPAIHDSVKSSQTDALLPSP